MRQFRTMTGGTLGRRLIGLVVTALAVSFVVTALVTTWQDVTRQARLESQRMGQVAEVIGSLAADATAQGDRVGTFRAIRSVGRIDGVSYARITAADGTLLAETGSGARLMSEASLDDGRQLSVWSALTTGSIQTRVPVIHEGRPVGDLTLFSRTPDLRDRVLAGVWISLVGALVAAVIGMAVASRMARRIGAPVIALAEVVRGVDASGDYSRPADIEAEGEVADLVQGFNTMLDGIRQRDARIQSQIEGLEGEVQARTAELVTARDAAETANAAKSDFLAVMSHEIRTPMNGILALSDMLARSDLPARQQRYADVIAKSGQSLLSIINDILDFSKVEAGKMELEAVEVDLAEVAEDVASLFMEKALQKGLDLAVFVDPRLPTVMADPVRLRQVIGNLANNAIKFTDVGGVTLSLRPSPDRPDAIRVAVTDTGPGIPEDKLPTLFEAFTQADQSTTRKYGGTGLGLAICDRLVRAMDGQWRLSSRVGTGSVFAFDVPLATAAPAPVPGIVPNGWTLRVGQVGDQTRAAILDYLAAFGGVEGLAEAAILPGDATGCGPLTVRVCETEDQAADLPPEVCALVKPIRRAELTAVIDQLARGQAPRLEDRTRTARDTVRFAGARVLVVDDSDVNREVAAEVLGRFGVVPAMAHDGREAVERLRAETFDLVLMDGSMPVLDGFSATRIVREEEAAEPARGRVPIVALTAHVVGSGAQAWRDCGMDGVIHKPFTTSDLSDVLTRFCADRMSVGEPVDAPATAPAAAAVSEASVDPHLFDPTVRAELMAMAADGRGDFVTRVQGLYAVNAPLRLSELKAGEDASDTEAVARAAHALKSMSLSLGARAVAQAASEIEGQARGGRVPTGGAARLGGLVIRTLTGMGLTGDSAVEVDAVPAPSPVPASVEPTMPAAPGPATGPAGRALDVALAAGHLHLQYQRLVERTGEPSPKVEALVRWTDPDTGRRGPDDFIPPLEAEGAIARLTDFVLDRAMAEMAARPGIRVSVNASATEFQSPDFALRVARALAARDFPPDRLEIEVTETAMLDIAAARRGIEALREIGVGVALDDFGAGYTSLHALRELKFTTLKIDRSFVDRCVEDTASAAIIHAVIGVGRSLGMKVVCEGVETGAQADFLRIAGAHYLQGYHFHRPCAAQDLDPAMPHAA